MFLQINVRPIGWANISLIILVATLFGVGGALTTAAEIRGEVAPNPFGQSVLTTNSLLEQFKAFISSPPPISNIVFQQKVPMGGGARPLDGTFQFSTSFEYFQARWQTNGLLFRRISGPGDVTNLTVAGQLVSWAGHEHALVEPNRQLTTWDDRDPSVAGKSISVFYTSQFFLDPLREILNLGIRFVDIGTVHWESNRFRVETEVDHERLRVTGEVVPARDGPPVRLNVRYESQNRTNNYVLRYGYTPELAYSFPPSSITNFWLAHGKEIELDEWKILKFEIAEIPLPAAAFDVAPFRKQHQWPVQIYTNGAFYELTAAGNLRFLTELNIEKPRSLAAARRRLLMFYAAWGGANLTIFALMVGAREKQQTLKDKGLDYEVQV